MRIVHVYDGHEKIYDGRGSVPGVVWNVARETASRGHDVTVVERQWDGLASRATHEGVDFQRLALRTGASDPWERVPFETVGSPTGFSKMVLDRVNFAREALQWLWKHEYDVLHVHLPLAANVLLTVAPWLRERTVFTAHLGELRLDLLASDEDADGVDASETATTAAVADGGAESEPDVPGILSLFSPDSYIAKRAAATTVLNPAIERAFADRGVPEDRISVVPNGVDLDRFGESGPAERERVRDAYDLDDRPLVLFVGSIMPRKGVAELVHALDAVTETTDATPRVLLAGKCDLDDDYTARVERLITETELDSTISMTGFVPSEDLPVLYELADVCVVPSLEEGFGMTAIEAMASGTPIVGTRVGGLPHVLEEGAHGRLVPPGDVDALASALGEVLASAPELGSLAEGVRDRARDFSWESVGDDFEGVYEEVTR